MLSSRSLLLLAAMFALATSPGSAWSQVAFGAEAMKMYGGTYRADCKDPASPSLTVFQDSLVFTHGNQRFVGTNVEQFLSAYGRMIPPYFRVSLDSYLPGNRMLSASMFVDESGAYLEVNAHLAVEKEIGEAALAVPYDRCDPAGTGASARSTLGPVEISPEPGAGLPNASLMPGNPHFRVAYLTALGPLSTHPWLAHLDQGTIRPTRWVTVGGSRYLLILASADHDSRKNNVTLLYSFRRRIVYGKVFIAGKSTLLGSPPPTVARSLGTLSRKTWG